MGSPCDTLSVGVDDNVPEQKVFFQAWYNSDWNMIHVNASKLKGRTGSLRLFDMEGSLEGHWSVQVNGNWRMTFRFEAEDAVLVDYQDYH